MRTLEDIRHALEDLPNDERDAIAIWLQELSSAPDRNDRVEEPQLAYARAQAFMSLDEYMKFEEQSSFRHEYVNGVVHAMSGPSLAHVRITGELFVAFKTHLRGSPCEPFATDAKLRIHSETDEIVYYPDVVVACNRDEWGTNYVCNPKLIVEIQSGESRYSLALSPASARPTPYRNARTTLVSNVSVAPMSRSGQ